MQQGIKKLQWLEYLKVVFLEILNPLLCRVFANQITYCVIQEVKKYFGKVTSWPQLISNLLVTPACLQALHLFTSQMFLFSYINIHSENMVYIQRMSLYSSLYKCSSRISTETEPYLFMKKWHKHSSRELWNHKADMEST